jgi:F420 biosynthesis protein FbiB-like protein
MEATVSPESLLQLLDERRSVRRFKPDPVPEDALVRLIEAATLAPSASNKQPWRFLIVTSRPTIDAMTDAVRSSVERVARAVPPDSEAAFRAYGDYFTRFSGAPCVIVPICRGPAILSHLASGPLDDGDRARIAAMEAQSAVIGASLALQNLLLMAHASGLGASGMTGPLLAEDRLRTILDVPASWTIVALIPVGYPDEEPTKKDRKAAEKVTRWIK